jgi:hypothetical protein
VSQRIALWLVPIAIAVHNLEEALFIPAFLPFVNHRLRAIFGAAAPDLTARTYFIALSVVTVIPFVIAATGNLSRKSAPAVYAMVTIALLMLVNVAVHLGSTVLAGGYAPGLVTAVVANLPLFAYVVRRAVREQWVRRWTAVTITAILLHGPGLMTLLLVARRFG